MGLNAVLFDKEKLRTDSLPGFENAATPAMSGR